MPPSLGKLNLLPPEDLEVSVKRLTGIPQDAMRTMEERGMRPLNPPAGYAGEMPNDLTSLDDEDLGDLLNRLSAWCAYVGGQLAQASTQRNAAKAAFEKCMARVRLAYKTDDDGKKLTVQDKNDYVLCDPRVDEAHARFLYADSLYDLTKVFADAAQLNWETVSRRITQRGQEIDRMKRQTNVAGVPAQATRQFRRPT